MNQVNLTRTTSVLSSAVNLNVDLDVVLCVLAQALTAAFRLRLPGNYAHATPVGPQAPAGSLFIRSEVEVMR